MNEPQKSSADDRFDKLVTILISSVAILVAVTAFLQNYASTRSDQANRHAQELAIQSTTKRVTGAIQFSYDWQSAFQTWREVHLQMIAAQQSGDTLAEERYTKLKDKIAALSPLLGTPYFDASTNWPDIYQYESDLYLIESTRLSELYAAESAVGRAWADTADRFVIQITLLTVALSLYGLSLTLKGRTRWLFIIVGSGIVGFCALWLGVELILPKPEVSERAIDAYARGVGLAYIGKDDEAIASFDEAVTIKPDYANAYYERGFSYYYNGDYQKAVSDFVRAREAGRDDVTLYWNLGWTYYLLGQYDQAIAANNVVLDKDSTVLGVRMNQGLSKLAKGDLNGARLEYDLLIQEAERQVTKARASGQEPPASLWYYMDAGAADLQNLIDQLDNNPKYWTLAPQVVSISGDHQTIKSLAFEQMARIKESTLALEHEGRLPSMQDAMTVTVFQFGHEQYDQQGEISGFDEVPDAVFPNQTDAVTVYFEYTGPAPKTPLVWKVYRDGVEDTSSRDIWIDIDLLESNAWYKFINYTYTNVFVFTPGEYTVELYADYRLVGSGTFYVQEE